NYGLPTPMSQEPCHQSPTAESSMTPESHRLITAFSSAQPINNPSNDGPYQPCAGSQPSVGSRPSFLGYDINGRKIFQVCKEYAIESYTYVRPVVVSIRICSFLII